MLGIEPLIARSLALATCVSQPAAPRPRSTVWHLSHIARFFPWSRTTWPFPRVLCEECCISYCPRCLLCSYRKALSFFAKIGREQRLVTQEWTPERAAALITWWNEGICASEIGRRLSVTKNAVIGKAFAFSCRSAGRHLRRSRTTKRHPTGATGSGNVQLATGRDRRKRLSLLWLGGRPGNPTAIRTANWRTYR